MPRIKEIYQQNVVPALMKRFNYQNVMQVPKLEKIVVNMGLGEAIQNVKILDSAAQEMTVITGQKPVITKGKKSIAQFKLRKGLPIGCMVTLRKERMMEFFNRLVNIALPRVRDFKGLSGKSFDGRGNYALGIREQLIFPEIHYDKIDKVKGMNIVIVTTARTDEEAKELLRLLNAFPKLERKSLAESDSQEEEIGKDITQDEGTEITQIQGPPIPSMSSLWKTQSLLSEVQHVSTLS